MREKIWTDCPSCGARQAMCTQRDMTECIALPGYPELRIDGLSGQFCSVCGEGFWSLQSERSIASQLAEHRAHCDSEHIVASKLASVVEASSAMNVSVQGVHKMMKEGRLRYVFAAGHRLPIREEVLAMARERAQPASTVR